MSKVQRFWCHEALNIRCVREADYDALAAEAKALREEVAEYEALCNRQADLLSQSIVAIRGPEPELTRWGYADLPLRVKTVVEEVAALRARVVVVPERLTNGDSISRMLREIGCDGDVSYHHAREIWNACLDELARLNGKTVSEGLLRRLTADPDYEEVFTLDRGEALTELLDLLNQDKENGNG
ncbi:hypothetical protein ACSQ43_001863 [Pseudomonas aeruginosa]|uniref:hypothetical protein n=1 Tax=Pseudomonas aeruginosa TaxID=287 RepID=UPI00071B21D1|nr:hypothetical protein [Pseudomonas aeruginosa]EIU4871603.1 hypothetical protein [Pseudomonas aeruginosa]KSH18334.1 hypothetical protein AO964_01430 [Pseudomonas aeruginosa]MBG5624068.1 hypothetical protein [Pseudomonas aeruginosa]MBI8070628.1 hypothetical protein [Pseudomonas aeruginosa]